MEAQHKHDVNKQETVNWGVRNDQSLASDMHALQGHRDEQIQVDRELSDEELEEATIDVASLKEETTAFKTELSDLKRQRRKSCCKLTQPQGLRLAKSRRMKVGTVSLFGREQRAFLQQNGTSSAQVVLVETFLETNAGS
jgi:uncharacterized protein (DUF2384 family)